MLPLKVLSQLLVRWQQHVQDLQSFTTKLQTVNQSFEAILRVEVEHELFRLLHNLQQLLCLVTLQLIHTVFGETLAWLEHRLVTLARKVVKNEIHKLFAFQRFRVRHYFQNTRLVLLIRFKLCGQFCRIHLFRQYFRCLLTVVNCLIKVL